MIDFIKFKIKAEDKFRFEKSIDSNELVTLKSTFDVHTGVANDYPKMGTLKNMEIRITEKGAIVKGSMHKYYNLINGLGDQNYNDFSFEQWEIAIEDLCKKLDIDKEQTKITNLEFGFNIPIQMNIKTLIESHIIMYDLKDHNRKHNFRGRGSYKEFEKTDYALKVYDKGKPNFILNKNILRMELKITGSRYLKKLGIVNLNQLGVHAFKDLFRAFLTHYNKLMIVDSLKAPKGIREDQLILFKNCINPNHWSEINTLEKKETRREFNKLIKKYGHNVFHSALRDKIYGKYKLLMNLKSLQSA